MNNLLALAQHLGLEVFEFSGNYYVGATQEEIERLEEESELTFDETYIESEYVRLDDELQESSHDSNVVEYGSQEYLVVDDSTADYLWERELDNYIEECILPEMPDSLRNYFDEESWKRDARFDGRGHSLNHYDGTEYEDTVNGETFYIYRQN